VKDILIKEEKTRVRRKAVSVLMMMILFINVLVIFILTPPSNVSALSIDQRVEPAIVLGSDIADFIGTAVDELWVYAYVSGIWEQIPFQLDEKNDTTNSYFVDAIDGFLDSNDEIVFMPDDAGDFAPETSWVPNTESQRYEVVVTDPIDSSMKYAYIYNSSSLTQTFTEDYVNFNPTTYVITATDYTIGFKDTKLGIIDEIRVNTSIGGDNTNLLDRMKYRLQVTIGITLQFDEEDFDYTMVGYKDGPVRFIQQIGTGDIVAINYAYKSYAIATQEMNIAISPDWIRVSLDFLSSATPMTYYDSNANVMTIDGSTDTPASTNPPTWVEVTGASGTLVIPRDLTQVGGTPSLYYADDSLSNDGPESETGEYGDSGIYIVDPPVGTSSTFLSFYFLPPNQTNVGSTYESYVNNPLTINTISQFVDPSPPPEITNVFAYPDPQDLEGYVNISANIVDNYELYGAWIDITDPKGSPVGNFSLNYSSLTSKYYDNRTYDIVGTYGFTIWANDTNDNWNFSFGQFVIRDIILPEISDVKALPALQEVEGFVNISCVLDDNYQLYGAWVEITDPMGNPAGNFSMRYDLSTDRYYLDTTYDIVGTYQYTIWANDSSNNWNFSFGQFVMEDTTLSSIIDITVFPDPQEVGGFVNISAIIEDNYQLYGTRVEITDPFDNPVGNFSMSFDAGTNRYYIEQVYDIVGTYGFTIFANDSSNNWNFSLGQFKMHDTTLPEIYDITTFPDPQEVNGLVDISAIITDNYDLNEVWVNITDPDNNLVGNFSMNFETMRYHNEQTFDIVGMYQFTIFANDTSNNWNLSQGQFQIHDITLPEISDVETDPNPQNMGDFVNISAVVTDNVGVDIIWIEIKDQYNELVGNSSMSFDPIKNRYYENRVYDIAGRYQFIIWAKDASDNWKSKSGSFTIQDSQPPEADAGSDQAVIEGTTVTFEGSGSVDNVGIVEYEWTFTDGSLQTLSGMSPIYTFNNVFNFMVTLTVFDAEANEDTDIMWVNVSLVPDTTKPIIIHTPETSGTVGEPLSIIAEIMDNNEVTEAILFYRKSGESEYTEVAMSDTSGDEWTADIPSFDMTIEGIEYYIFATDGVNDVTEPSGNPYSVNVKDEGAEEEEGFPFLVLLIVIIVIVSLILIMLFLMKKKGKGEPTTVEPVVVEAVEMP
jgi:hypothetical protein